MVKMFLQWGLQAPGQRLAFVRQQCEQQIQCPGTAIQLLVPALTLFQLRLLLAQLLFQAFGTPGFKPNTNVPKFPLPVFLGLLQGLDRALKTVDILLQNIRPGLADLLVRFARLSRRLACCCSIRASSAVNRVNCSWRSGLLASSSSRCHSALALSRACLPVSSCA